MGIEDLKGITLLNIELEREPDQLMFYSECGRRWRMWHCQDCCENVVLQDIIGELSDLVGAPILVAEERVNGSETEWGHETWTFSELATIKGSVTLRWLGESNGYYSEAVDFEQLMSVEESLRA
jgi:hypothetical protein